MWKDSGGDIGTAGSYLGVMSRFLTFRSVRSLLNFKHVKLMSGTWGIILVPRYQLLVLFGSLIVFSSNKSMLYRVLLVQYYVPF